ncbi:hypothetical protein [Nitrosospira multiformis]|nr:hypothetical protein [Nitrosospira multiformis]
MLRLNHTAMPGKLQKTLPIKNLPLIHQILPVFVLAAFAVLASFLWQGHKGFNLWDEGYLWYGAQRVLLGEVPLRDFMSYDPGRYYWSAALMSLWGDNGIMALRGAVAVFQAIGLFTGLLLIAQKSLLRFKFPGFLYLLLSAITLMVWMYPRHKLFDISLSILLVGVSSFLVQHPARLRYFVCGLGIGLVAVFGRNHGLYGAMGSAGVMVWLAINPDSRKDQPGFVEGLLLWAAGVAAGFTPLLAMALLVPGFAGAFWESIRFLSEVKATNLSLPVPWPWKVSLDSIPSEEAIRGVLIGVLFIGILIFSLVGVAWSLFQKFHNKAVSPVLVASVFLGLPYAHYAYSRADVGHLAQSIFPLLIGCLVLLAAQPPKIKWSFAAALCIMSLWVMHAFHPGWQCHTSGPCKAIEISGNRLMVLPEVESDVRLLRKLAKEYAPDGGSFVATPFWPGAYPLLNTKSPMWEIYALFPRNGDFQQEEIRRIAAASPGFVLIYDLPLDGREELRFRNTHPLIYRYIVEYFDRLPDPPNLPYQIYTSRKPAG